MNTSVAPTKNVSAPSFNSFGKRNKSVSIVIPAYNEAERLVNTLETVLSYLQKQVFESELIIVNDGSTDNTAEIAKQSLTLFAGGVPARVINYEKNRGKGYAVRTGLLAANNDITLFSDADLSTPISEMKKLVKPIIEGAADVTFGSRALDRSLIETHQPWRREQGGKIFNFVVRLMTGLPFWDTQCGFKSVCTRVFRPIVEAMEIDRFGFDVEMLFVAHRAGLSLQEIPVRWHHCEGSKVNVLRDSRKMLGEVYQIRRNMRRGKYDEAIRAIKSLKQNKSTTSWQLN